eukprot:SM000190S04867  [mRNA]  locus=s190:260500:261737:+ [translate_table: standard]
MALSGGGAGGAHDEDAGVELVLLTEDSIRSRVRELGRAISADFRGRPLVVVGVATGAFIFMADLVRCISVPLKVDIIRARSYGAGTTTTGLVALSGDLKVDLKDSHVLVVEDILDTGRTLSALVEHLTGLGPASVSLCVLLDKAARREVELSLPGGGALYVGFPCPDQFVVGYGLDFNEGYRSLPYVGVLKSHLYDNSLPHVSRQ